jgi:hypothetical protein
VPAALWLSWSHPLVFFAALAVALVLMVGLIWFFSKFLFGLARRVSGWLTPNSPAA